MDKIWANSGDSHLVEPDEVFATCLPPAVAARMPRSVQDDDGRMETIHVDGESFRRRIPRSIGMKDGVGRARVPVDRGLDVVDPRSGTARDRVPGHQRLGDLVPTLLTSIRADRNDSVAHGGHRGRRD